MLAPYGMVFVVGSWVALQNADPSLEMGSRQKKVVSLPPKLSHIRT